MEVRINRVIMCKDMSDPPLVVIGSLLLEVKAGDVGSIKGISRSNETSLY